MVKFDTKAYMNEQNEGLEKRLTIGKDTQVYKSYKFPIEFLYYNDLNGRIASCIEEYNDQNEENISTLKDKNIEKYNDILSEYIIKSASDNGESFKKTKEDIRVKGQQIPGVILTDGRIIDGNRRFTALRELYKEEKEEYNNPYAYFEAVCLEAPDADDKDGWKKIKTLELYLQFNVDDRREYNRIDELVSFYRDVMDDSTKLFGEKSYCLASGISKKKFSDNVKIVFIMLDYLDWRNKPKAFYILKNEKLDGPIEEIAKSGIQLDSEEWNSKKDTIYQYMTIVNEGDRTRSVRDLLKSAKADGPLFQHVLDLTTNEETNDKIFKYLTSIDKNAETPQETVERQNLKKELSDKIKNSFSDGKYFECESNAISLPATNVEKAIKIISAINKVSVKQLSENSKKDFLDKLELLKGKIKELEDEN